MNAYATERMLQPVLDNLVNLSPSIKFEFHFADAPYMIPLITDIQLPGYATNTHVEPCGSWIQHVMTSLASAAWSCFAEGEDSHYHPQTTTNELPEVIHRYITCVPTK